MNNIMPCLITALTGSHTINRTMEEKNEQQNKQNIFTAKLQHLNLKAPSNNVKTQSQETLTTDGTLYYWD